MLLYIVRHGQTEENKKRILQGHLPGTLTEQGKEQVRKAAEELAKKEIEYKCIVSSDLKRAMDSAQIIADRLNLPVIPMKLLRERDWGKYTGLLVSEAQDIYKKDGKWVFPDESAETDEGILERAKQVLAELGKQYTNDNVIVVTHGQFARNLIAATFDCSYHEVTSMVNAEVRMLSI